MTLTEQMKADGWIEHDGGPCPVAPDCRVIVMQRTGHIRNVRKASHWSARADEPDWGQDCWIHQAEWCDIIAYRPEQPQ
jgi:hypothetical protein